jgi:predicted nucleic-acid-binding Zn-ribbon protein
MSENGAFKNDESGLLICKKCGSTEFHIHQDWDAYDTSATCVKCGTKDSIHSG